LPGRLIAVEEPVESVRQNFVATAAAIHHVPVRLATGEVPRPDEAVAGLVVDDVLPGVEEYDVDGY
jgi:hypothetical protein